MPHSLILRLLLTKRDDIYKSQGKEIINVIISKIYARTYVQWRGGEIIDSNKRTIVGNKKINKFTSTIECT